MRSFLVGLSELHVEDAQRKNFRADYPNQAETPLLVACPEFTTQSRNVEQT